MQRPSPGSDWVFGQPQHRSRAGRLSGLNRVSRQRVGTFAGHQWIPSLATSGDFSLATTGYFDVATVNMFLGRKLSPAASDFREYRLFKLIEAGVFSVPTDQNVADLFQLTLPQARTLIRNVYTKYRFELSAGRDLLLKQTLSGAQADPNDEARFFLTIGSRAIADALNDRLLRYGGGARLTLSRGSQTQYTIDKASLSTLVEKLGATPPKDL